MRPIEHKRNWRIYLDALIFARLQTPFAWGSNDCALFAADAVLATTGVDPAVNMRGYRTAREALRLIRRLGGLWGLATMMLGQHMAPTYACTGDVALIATSPGSKREALAVCISPDKAAAPGPNGLQVVPMDHARCIWRVG